MVTRCLNSLMKRHAILGQELFGMVYTNNIKDVKFRVEIYSMSMVLI